MQVAVMPHAAQLPALLLNVRLSCDSVSSLSPVSHQPRMHSAGAGSKGPSEGVQISSNEWAAQSISGYKTGDRGGGGNG